VCCSVLQCVAVRFSIRYILRVECIVVCCGLLQCVAVCRGVLWCGAVCCSVFLDTVGIEGVVYCSVLQCVAVCCSALQCVSRYGRY